MKKPCMSDFRTSYLEHVTKALAQACCFRNKHREIDKKKSDVSFIHLIKFLGRQQCKLLLSAGCLLSRVEHGESGEANLSAEKVQKVWPNSPFAKLTNCKIREIRQWRAHQLHSSEVLTSCQYQLPKCARFAAASPCISASGESVVIRHQQFA